MNTNVKINNEIPKEIVSKSQRVFCYTFFGISALSPLIAGLYEPKLSVPVSFISLLVAIPTGLKLAGYIEKRELRKLERYSL